VAASVEVACTRHMPCIFLWKTLLTVAAVRRFAASSKFVKAMGRTNDAILLQASAFVVKGSDEAAENWLGNCPAQPLKITVNRLLKSLTI